MSAVAQSYVYQVKVNPNKKKAEPTVSREALKKYQADVAKYLTPKKCP